MIQEQHKAISGKIWEIANRLRGPYRPPQYRLVMLPMVVLRRFDCVLEPTKDAVVALMGLQFMEQYQFSYSYDITVSPIRHYSSGSHEIMFGFRVK